MKYNRLRYINGIAVIDQREGNISMSGHATKTQIRVNEKCACGRDWPCSKKRWWKYWHRLVEYGWFQSK